MKKIMLLLPFLFLGTVTQAGQDLTAEIRRQLATGDTGPLFYPRSVKRFYEDSKFSAAWIKPQSGTGPAWQALLLLDCLEQYGLSPGYYHTEILTYDRMRRLLAFSGNNSIHEQARVEILITDAIITLINHLHFGRLNPMLTGIAIDGGPTVGFHAGLALRDALLKTHNYDFYNAIENVQPRSKAYRDLQYRLRLITGVYTCDNYDFTQSEIRLIAINMERLRWSQTTGSNHLWINIPSYTLRYYRGSSVYTFPIAVGKPTGRTPAFNGMLRYFTTAPDVRIKKDIFLKVILPKALHNPLYLDTNHLSIYNSKGRYQSTDALTLAKIAEEPDSYYARQASGCYKALSNMVFRLGGPSGTDLYDIPEKSIFERKKRAISKGCMWLEQGERLASLLLIAEGRQKELKGLHKAITSYQRQAYLFVKPIPVTVTYLTCELKADGLVTYQDIYELDKDLQKALFADPTDKADDAIGGISTRTPWWPLTSFTKRPQQ